MNSAQGSLHGQMNKYNVLPLTHRLSPVDCLSRTPRHLRPRRIFLIRWHKMVKSNIRSIPFHYRHVRASLRCLFFCSRLWLLAPTVFVPALSSTQDTHHAQQSRRPSMDPTPVYRASCMLISPVVSLLEEMPGSAHPWPIKCPGAASVSKLVVLRY